MGILDAADQNSIMLWCTAYDDFRGHRDFIAEHGGTFKVTDQAGNECVREHPAARGAREAWKAMRGMLGEFGFTPAARVRLGSMDEPEDEFSMMLKEMLMKKKRKQKKKPNRN